MNLPRFRFCLPAIAALVGTFLLSQCTTLDAERKASIRKVVVVNNIGEEITRHRVGITVFGNKTPAPVRDPRLTSAIRRILEEETRSRFQEVIFAAEKPPHQTKSLFRKVDYLPLVRRLAAEHQADAVLLIVGRHYYPYAAPSYMTAEGLGLWHLPMSHDLVVCCNTMTLFDPQAKPLGFMPSLIKSQTIPALRYEEDFSRYPLAEQERILRACQDAFRDSLASYLKTLGF